MPRSRVCCTYLIAYLAAWMWACVEEFWYFVSMEVMVDVSGRVLWRSHCMEPTKERSCACSFIFSGGGGGGAVIASTGRPDRYGVRTGLDESESPAISTRLSANAVWER